MNSVVINCAVVSALSVIASTYSMAGWSSWGG
jgi:hypothetical protein